MQKSPVGTYEGISDNSLKINNNIYLDTSYNNIIKILGKPLKVNEITNVDFENRGFYFSQISYDEIGFIIMWKDKKSINKKGTVIQIDITGSYTTGDGIEIGNSLSQVNKIYKYAQLHRFIDNNNFGGISRDIAARYGNSPSVYSSFNQAMLIGGSLKENTLNAMLLCFGEDLRVSRIVILKTPIDKNKSIP